MSEIEVDKSSQLSRAVMAEISRMRPELGLPQLTKILAGAEWDMSNPAHVTVTVQLPPDVAEKIEITINAPATD